MDGFTRSNLGDGAGEDVTASNEAEVTVVSTADRPKLNIMPTNLTGGKAMSQGNTQDSSPVRRNDNGTFSVTMLKRKCLTCGHLFREHSENLNKCYSDPECTARHITFQFGRNPAALAEALAMAMFKNDIAAVTKINTKITKRNDCVAIFQNANTILASLKQDADMLPNI